MRRIRQSVCRWCFKELSLEALAKEASALSLVGIDLVEPSDWETLAQYGLICTMTPSHTIEKGLNNAANHPECLAKIRAAIEATAAAGFPNVICFSGNCEPGISHEAGIANCVDAIKQIIGLAEDKRVTICMELLNSKIDHPGYMCDRSDWGAEVVRRVGSARFKLLYDIYHMQVQEGDVIATINRHAAAIGHFHTAGVPGRHEMDHAQELNYPAIVRAIAATGFEGVVAHEFIATGDALSALRQAVKMCDV